MDIPIYLISGELTPAAFGIETMWFETNAITTYPVRWFVHYSVNIP